MHSIYVINVIFSFREKDSSEKNVISDNETSSINTTVVSMKSIQDETSMASSEATMSSSESRTSYTSVSYLCLLIKKIVNELV